MAFYSGSATMPDLVNIFADKLILSDSRYSDYYKNGTKYTGDGTDADFGAGAYYRRCLKWEDPDNTGQEKTMYIVFEIPYWDANQSMFRTRSDTGRYIFGIIVTVSSSWDDITDSPGIDAQRTIIPIAWWSAGMSNTQKQALFSHNTAYWLWVDDEDDFVGYAYNADTAAYTALTAEMKSLNTDDVFLPPLQAITSGDIFYIGHINTQFEKVIVDVSTAGVYTDITLSYEYYNGTAWVPLTVSDNTSGFTVPGENEITFVKPGDWAKNTIEGQEAYYLRVITSIGASPVITTSPLAKIVRCDYSLIPERGNGLCCMIKPDSLNDYGWSTWYYSSSVLFNLEKLITKEFSDGYSQWTLLSLLNYTQSPGGNQNSLAKKWAHYLHPFSQPATIDATGDTNDYWYLAQTWWGKRGNGLNAFTDHGIKGIDFPVWAALSQGGSPPNIYFMKPVVHAEAQYNNKPIGQLEHLFPWKQSTGIVDQDIISIPNSTTKYICLGKESATSTTRLNVAIKYSK